MSEFSVDRFGVPDIVGRRALLKIGVNPSMGETVEYSVVEVAPSGNWIKLRTLNGAEIWKPIREVVLVELLRNLNAGEPDEPDREGAGALPTPKQ
jgi:hypothetical protein